MRAFTTAMRRHFFSRGEEVRPEFSLSDDDQFRAKMLEVRSDREAQIEREIKDVGFAKAGACQFLSGVGSGGDNHSTVRPALAEVIDQPADGEHFADRNSMEPDRRRG